MAEINLTTQTNVDTTNDNIVIVNSWQDIPGGKALDVTGWPHTTIPAGHPIVLGTSGEYKPIALNVDEITIDEAEAARTVGILKATILTEQPIAAIMVGGCINPSAAVYTIPAACKAVLPHIIFQSE